MTTTKLTQDIPVNPVLDKEVPKQPLTIPKATIPASKTAMEEAKAYLVKNPHKAIKHDKESDESEPNEIAARSLGTFVKRLSGNDPDELLKHRFLCRKGGLLVVGQTGAGKSSLTMQMMIQWALGKSCFGIEPARPLKSLLLQAENDDGDLGDMKAGVFSGLNLSPG